MDWVLRNEINLQFAVNKYFWNDVHREPWTLHDPMCMSKNIVNIMRLDDENGTLVKDVFSWDSDDENAIDTTGSPRAHERSSPLFHCFGYHPYKEIVLFYDDRHCTITAYHLNSSKIRYLGKVESFYNDIREWFPYAAGWGRDLPGSCHMCNLDCNCSGAVRLYLYPAALMDNISDHVPIFSINGEFY